MSLVLKELKLDKAKESLYLVMGKFMKANGQMIFMMDENKKNQ